MRVEDTTLHQAGCTEALNTRWYSVLGIPVSVTSNVDAVLQCVDQTYTAFQSVPIHSKGTIAVQLQEVDAGLTYLVHDSLDYQQCWPNQQAALLDMLDLLVHRLLAQLQTQGIFAIHAGATVYRNTALLLAGRSGQGKTSLVLGLLRRGLKLLSDEFAIVEQSTQHILPYRRSLHIRPGTPELIPELGFLSQVPMQQLGGGIEWALAPQALESVLPKCLGDAAPLRYVLLLEGTPRADAAPILTPVSAALATLEVLRSTWATSVNFEGGLQRIGRLLDNVVCARLQVGAFEATIDQIIVWLEAHRG